MGTSKKPTSAIKIIQNILIPSTLFILYVITKFQKLAFLRIPLTQKSGKLDNT